MDRWHCPEEFEAALRAVERQAAAIQAIERKVAELYSKRRNKDARRDRDSQLDQR